MLKSHLHVLWAATEGAHGGTKYTSTLLSHPPGLPFMRSLLRARRVIRVGAAPGALSSCSSPSWSVRQVLPMPAHNNSLTQGGCQWDYQGMLACLRAWTDGSPSSIDFQVINSLP